MDRKKLEEIIITVEQRGFQIYYFICDGGNKTLLSQCGYYNGMYYIPNPFDPTRRVYIIPDGPQ